LDAVHWRRGHGPRTLLTRMSRSTQSSGWSAKLARIIELHGDIKLATLSEARAFVLGLPDDVHAGGAWQRVAGLLLEAAEDNGRIEAATAELEHALFSYGLWMPTEGRWPRPGSNVDRTEQRFDIKPERLAGDTAYGSGANLNWLVNEAKIAPHIPVVDKSKREDGTFSREDFTFNKERNVYICPAGKVLTTTGRVATDGETLYYRARTRDCRSCPLKSQCCPKAPLRRVPRSIYEEARDVARALAKTEAFERSRRDRKRVEMLFAHLKRIFRLGRLRLRGPCGAQFEFTLAAIAQNLRRLAKLVVRPPPVTEACFA
jgi:Transposase DDE domain